MHTLVYSDANGDTHTWIFRTEELALAMQKRVAAKWYHAWKPEIEESGDPELFIHTLDFQEALDDWSTFSNHEESFSVERTSVVNCTMALEALELPD